MEQVVSPVSVAHYSQYKLNRLLLKRVENLGFHVVNYDRERDPKPVREKEILMGHELVSIDASDRCLNVTASFEIEGKHFEKNIHCDILVGADGAGSTVRRLIGIDMIGENDLQKLVSVHFLSKDLGNYLLKERPGMLFFIFNTEAIGVLVAHDLRQGEFVLQVLNNLDYTESTALLKMVIYGDHRSSYRYPITRHSKHLKISNQRYLYNSLFC